VVASVAIVLGIVLAAHGSSPTHANTGPRPAATTTVPHPISKPPTASSPRCATAQLSVSAGFYGEAAGAYTQTFTFTNRSGGTCQMGGWPDFVVVSNSGQTLRTQTQHVRQNAPPEPVWTTIDLKPGAKASFDVYNSDSNPVAGTACPDTSAARITPPGTGRYLSVRVQIPDCHAFFEIAPIVAGAKDNGPWSEVVRSVAEPEMTLSPTSGRPGTLLHITVKSCPPPAKTYRYPTVFVHYPLPDHERPGVAPPTWTIPRHQIGQSVEDLYRMPASKRGGRALFVVFCGAGGADTGTATSAVFTVRPA